MTKNEVIGYLEQFAEKKNIEGMARFGIDPKNAIGVGMLPIRDIAKMIKTNDKLSDELWATDVHELKILAILIRDRTQFSEELADKWVEELYSWDICDQYCMKLIVYLDFSDLLIRKWVQDEREFVRRAGFATMASSALHKKKWADERFIDYLGICKDYSKDERNFVMKAVNWAIRQIGKKNMNLRDEALIICSEIIDEYGESKSARWIANNAITELENPKIIERIRKKSK